MTYHHIGGDFSKIEISGELLPERYAKDPEKVAIRGEDICYLAEHWKRFDNADRAAPVLFDFTRRISANQAFTVLSGIETLFRIGAALKSLPAAGQVVKSTDPHNSFSGLDLASSEDLEAMTPKPQPGLLVEVAPFLAAFRNVRKLAGFVILTELSPDYPQQTSIFARENNHSYSFNDSGDTIYYLNEWASIVEPGTNEQDRTGIEVCAAPNAWGDPWRPDGMASGTSLGGMRILSGTIYHVYASFSNYGGTSLEGSGNVIIFDSGWKDGVASRLSCSPGGARNNILPKLCDAVGVPWAMVGGNYSGISGNAAVRGYVTATVRRVAVCAF
jgi:hypothetical protein